MMAALSSFGKALRKLRIDRDIMLKTLAEGIGVSSAYLSSIETGQKPVNAQTINKIVRYLGLDDKQATELTKLASESRPDVVIKPANDYEAELALMFARRLDDDSFNFDRFKTLLEYDKGGI